MHHNEPPTSLTQALHGHDFELEPALRDSHPAIWLITLVGPFLLTLLLLATLWIFNGTDYLVRLMGVAAAAFFFLGRFIILLGHQGEMAEAARFTPATLAMMVFYMDLMVATLVSCHLRILFRLPWLGPAIRELINDGRFILKAHPWIRKVTFIGIVGLVTFPLASTGSIGGSIFGRLLGMSRPATFIGVVMGSLIGCSAMLLGADIIGRHLDKDDPFIRYGGIVVVVLIIIILNHRYRRLKAKYLEHEKQQAAARGDSAH